MIEVTEKIIQWHKDRNLIDGATDKTQVVKLLEEFIELYQAINKFDSIDDLIDSLKFDISSLWLDDRIDVSDKSKTKESLKDAIGDMDVVMINIAERNSLTKTECLESAYDDIKDRKGVMVDGMFIKESDL